MKVYFIDKYVILSFLLILIVTAALGAGISKTAEVAAVANHELPIYSVEAQEKQVAVTFDTAWGDEDIDEILKALESASCKATFFVTGQWLDKFPGSAKKIAAAGHEIANHTDSHKHLTKLSDAEVLAEANICREKIKSVTGQEGRLIRAPYGEYDKNIIRLLRGGGYTPVQWSLDSLDYKGLSPSEIDARILPKLKCGDIILFHTGTDNTAAYLPQILGKIKAQGYSFSTVGDMILKENYIIDSSGRQKRL
ncbi:MAG: polysaccharide deacetylase family protein [Clostridia bacterium]|nr:polysaccharide deacetylase family protein [Clostridia bacterium]